LEKVLEGDEGGCLTFEVRVYRLEICEFGVEDVELSCQCCGKGLDCCDLSHISTELSTLMYCSPIIGEPA